MVHDDFLIVGLGNPGRQYINTRHNIGFIVVDELAMRWGTSLSAEKWQAWSCRLNRWDTPLTLIKPLTYMNLSGRAVQEYAHFFKISSERLVVIHDDIDMAPGRLKLVHGGGAGGHNGIKSIGQSLGTNDFYRLKIGIGRPGKGDVHPEVPVENYVLSKFNPEEYADLWARIDIVEEGLRYLVEENPAKAMNLVNAVK
jgi:peptidyl-tRNA hydrolase, PTH1 family